jgi:Caspase recruitment domain
VIILRTTPDFRRVMCEFSLFSDSEIDFSHETLLKEHYTYLIQNIESSRLIHELYGKGLLDSMDMEDLQAKETETSRNEKLLSIIRRKSVLDFKKFLAALSAIGQSFIVNKVLETHQYNTRYGSNGM